MAFGKDLLTDDVGVPAVLGEFAEQMQVDPAQRKRAAAVTESEIVEAHRDHGRPRGDAGLGVGGLDGRDGVGVREQERVGHVGRQPLLDARDAADRLPEPHPLHVDPVLDQSQQRGARGHQMPTRLLFSEVVQAGVQRSAMLVQEGVELHAQVSVEDGGTRIRHEQSLSGSRPGEGGGECRPPR